MDSLSILWETEPGVVVFGFALIVLAGALLALAAHVFVIWLEEVSGYDV